jgi:hypothetical protein
LVIALLSSTTLNLLLWRHNTDARRERALLLAHEHRMAQAIAGFQVRHKPPAISHDANQRELARLRNEVTQLRRQSVTAKPLSHEDQLQAQLTAATQALAQFEVALSEITKLTPDERERARSIMCVHNLKQIGLAARIWADDHEKENGREILPPTSSP